MLKYQNKRKADIESEETTLKLPGEFLKEYLKTLGIPQKKFAHYIEINPSNLSKLINGERPINYELAIILGKIFNNISPPGTITCFALQKHRSAGFLMLSPCRCQKYWTMLA
ncbi:helix-turn-helix transcriptional regulator [Geofilum rubicundum]|uniref:helix-turn-helix transcriptional regulator n=1 Tax=Geofilum rubicundum TaxID=472113 RepID=UPI001D0E11B3|nr:helix-turn-helix domain-containing protein [Geofilum rubicundum]